MTEKLFDLERVICSLQKLIWAQGMWLGTCSQSSSQSAVKPSENGLLTRKIATAIQMLIYSSVLTFLGLTPNSLFDWLMSAFSLSKLTLLLPRICQSFSTHLWHLRIWETFNLFSARKFKIVELVNCDKYCMAHGCATCKIRTLLQFNSTQMLSFAIWHSTWFIPNLMLKLNAMFVKRNS